MSIIWLIVWLLSDTPTIAFQGPEAWNAWTIALLICVFVDLTSGGSQV